MTEGARDDGRHVKMARGQGRRPSRPKTSRSYFNRVPTMNARRRRQPPEPELRLKRSQRREIVMMITSDDMKLRLKQLVDQGRQQDCWH